MHSMRGDCTFRLQLPLKRLEVWQLGLPIWALEADSAELSDTAAVRSDKVQVLLHWFRWADGVVRVAGRKMRRRETKG